MELSTLLWESTWEELAQGYAERGEAFVCLLCGEAFARGVVYPSGDRLLEAQRAVKEHVQTEHESVLAFLLGLHKKHTGLSESQRRILGALGQGQDDAAIAGALSISSSTVRNHRFRLREKARQARVFLAIMALVEEAAQVDTFVAPHRSATVLDERFAITPAEQEKILRQAFTPEGRLKAFPAKEKKKIAILRALSERFTLGEEYSERQVNAILGEVFDDVATLRRYLIQYGFMERERDGSAYRKTV